MSSPSKQRNLEKELVVSCNISWRAAKDLTDAVRASGNNDDDAILQAAMNRYQQNPEAYVTVKRRTRDNSPRESSESSSMGKAVSMLSNDEDDDIFNEIEC